MKHHLLLVDDEPLQLESGREFLEKRGFAVDTAQGGHEAIRLVTENPARYSVVILDYQMPGINGASTTKALLEVNPNLFILIFSADPTRDAVLLPSRSGARGFVDKREGADYFLRELVKLCKEYEERFRTVEERPSASENEAAITQVGMVGRSAGIADVARRITQLRIRDGAVLILGETGTGKELVASALRSERRGPFVAVNCADFLMSPDTASSKLFGHVKGAFTGAISDKEGVIEAAGEGTLYLDEVYSLPIEAQTGLLRALESRKYTPVGSTKEREVHCRIIASAKPDLLRLVGSGAFKADLFYRISENIITVPALTERPEDIAPLVAHFCELWSDRYGVKKTFLASAIPYLERYSWPGNARELKNVVFSLLNTSDKERIGPKELDRRFREGGKETEAPAGALLPLKSQMDAAEKEHLVQVLGKSRSVRDAAKRLEVSPSTVLRLMERHGVDATKVLGAMRTDRAARR